MEEQHLSPKEAAHKAMADISGPVVAIALVLAAVLCTGWLFARYRRYDYTSSLLSQLLSQS